MNKVFLTFCFALLFLQGSSQVPPYKATVYDTTVTGYYFLCPITGAYSAVHTVLDGKGNIVYYKNISVSQSYDFKVQPNGMISYFRLGKFWLMDSTFYIRDTIIAANGLPTNVHDLQVLPNGHYLLLATETVIMDLSSYHYFNHNGSPGSTTANLNCNVIQELDENKNLVFEWHLKDHFSFDSVDPYFLSSPTTVDWSHTNSVELDTDGNIIFSNRHFDEITKINRTTGAVMWRLGGNYNQFTFLNDTVPFYGQHDARRNSNGNLSLFDDAKHTIPHGSRALEYHLDETNLTAQVVWAYTYDSAMYSGGLGNVQLLANQNRVVDYGIINTVDNVCFNVVRPDFSKVFELSFDDSIPSYRTFFYPQLPWSFNRPQVTCYDSAGSHYLDAGGGYSSYLWSNGSSTRIIQITSADTFYVFVPYGQGGVISSEHFIVGDTANPCGIPLSVNQIKKENSIQAFPIPAYDVLNIALPEQSINANDIVIYDPTGRIVYHKFLEKNIMTVSLDISFLEDGLYFISFGGRTAKFIKE